MCVQFTESELTQFQAVKMAFDEKGLLNRGKAIPALQRCAEFGACMCIKENSSTLSLSGFDSS